MRLHYHLREWRPEGKTAVRFMASANRGVAMNVDRQDNWPSVGNFTLLVPFLLRQFPYHVVSRDGSHAHMRWLEDRFRWLDAEIGPSAIRDGRHAPLYWTSGRWNFCGQDGLGYFVFEDAAEAVAFKMRWG